MDSVKERDVTRRHEVRITSYDATLCAIHKSTSCVILQRYDNTNQEVLNATIIHQCGEIYQACFFSSGSSSACEPVNVKFKMADYGLIKIPENGRPKSLPQ